MGEARRVRAIARREGKPVPPPVRPEGGAVLMLTLPTGALRLLDQVREDIKAEVKPSRHEVAQRLLLASLAALAAERAAAERKESLVKEPTAEQVARVLAPSTYVGRR